MPQFELQPEIIRELIEIGSTGRFELLHSLHTPAEMEYHGRMMILGKDHWYRVADTLNTADLVALIKCLTIAEKELKGWGGGSGSAVIWLFKRLLEIDHDDRVRLIDWILEHTRNDYVPFGTSNYHAKSFDEYNAFKRAAWVRAKERRKAQEERQELEREIARQNKAQKATRNLFRAVRRKDMKAIQALLAQGTDPTIKNERGVSALELAQSVGDGAIVELLFRYSYCLFDILGPIAMAILTIPPSK